MDQPEDATDIVTRSPLIYLAPVLPHAGAIAPALDRLLADVAATARHGDRTARDALYWAVAGRLEPSMRRQLRLHTLTYGPGMLELEDVQQSSYLVLVDMIESWDPGDSFVTYLFGMFHWRLRRELRVYAKRGEAAFPQAAIGREPATSTTAAMLERLLARLPERQRRIVELRLTRNLSFDEIRRLLGVTRRTITRDLEAIEAAVLRADLS